MECPVCEYPLAGPHYRMRDRFFETTSEEFILNRCASCGLLFLEEEKVKDRLDEFYPPGYWWTENGPASKLEKKYRDWMVRSDHLKFLLAACPEPGGRALLDIGCGGGAFLKQAVGAGFDATGLESSPEAAAIAERLVPGRVHCGSESDLIEQGKEYDIVTLFHCLEHVPGPFRYLKELRRLLKPDGLLLVQVPNAASFQARILGSRWYGLDCPRHIYNYSLFSIMHLLGRAGYRIHRLRHFSPRDNAAALVSSLFPSLDPMSQRVKSLRRKGRAGSFALAVRNAVYLPLMIMAQPLALLEARLGRGATVMICASRD